MQERTNSDLYLLIKSLAGVFDFASGEPSKMKAGKAAQRLKKSGSVEDAAGVFYNMIRSK